MRRFAGNFTAEKEEGKGSSRATYAVEEGISKWYRDSAYTSEDENTRAGRPIPSEHQGFGHSILLLI